jgi:sodium pump decarboxylase gamma subunit
MMENGILDQGLTLMLVGMGTVFAFLSVLVVAMWIMSLLIGRLTAVEESVDATNEEVAAISAALIRHRRQ